MNDLLQIIKEWRKDSKIDDTDLAAESLKIPTLHSKYYEMYIRERMIQQKQKAELHELEHIYTEYYSGHMMKEDLDKHGLEQFDKKVLKNDIPRWLESTKVIKEVKEKIGLQQEKMEFIKSILESIRTRSYVIRDAIEWKKFSAGF